MRRRPVHGCGTPLVYPLALLALLSFPGTAAPLSLWSRRLAQTPPPCDDTVLVFPLVAGEMLRSLVSKPSSTSTAGVCLSLTGATTVLNMTDNLIFYEVNGALSFWWAGGNNTACQGSPEAVAEALTSYMSSMGLVVTGYTWNATRCCTPDTPCNNTDVRVLHSPSLSATTPPTDWARLSGYQYNTEIWDYMPYVVSKDDYDPALANQTTALGCETACSLMPGCASYLFKPTAQHCRFYLSEPGPSFPLEPCQNGTCYLGFRMPGRCGLTASVGISHYGKHWVDWAPGWLQPNNTNKSDPFPLAWSSNDIPLAVNGLPALSVSECNCRCASVGNCAGYTWLPENKTCWMQRYVQPWEDPADDPNPHTTLGRVNTGDSVPACGTRLYWSDSAVYWYTAHRITSAAELPLNVTYNACYDACFSDPACQAAGFNTSAPLVSQEQYVDCYLYSEVSGGLVEEQNTGLFQMQRCQSTPEPRVPSTIVDPAPSWVVSTGINVPSATYVVPLTNIPATLGRKLQASNVTANSTVSNITILTSLTAQDCFTQCRNTHGCGLAIYNPTQATCFTGFFTGLNSTAMNALTPQQALQQQGCWEGSGCLTTTRTPGSCGFVASSGVLRLGMKWAGWRPGDQYGAWGQSLAIDPALQNTSVASASDCACICQRSANCITYVYLGDVRQCWLQDRINFSGAFEQDQSPETVVARLTPPVGTTADCSKTPTYTIPDSVTVTVNSSRIQRRSNPFPANSTAQCNQACLMEPFCVAYILANVSATTSNCTLYSSVISKGVTTFVGGAYGTVARCPFVPVPVSVTPPPPATQVPTPVPPSTPTESQSKGRPAMAVGIGVGVGVGAAALLIMTLAVFIVKRRREKEGRVTSDKTRSVCVDHENGEPPPYLQRPPPAVHDPLSPSMVNPVLSFGVHAVKGLDPAPGTIGYHSTHHDSTTPPTDPHSLGYPVSGTADSTPTFANTLKAQDSASGSAGPLLVLHRELGPGAQALILGLQGDGSSPCVTPAHSTNTLGAGKYSGPLSASGIASARASGSQTPKISTKELAQASGMLAGDPFLVSVAPSYRWTAEPLSDMVAVEEGINAGSLAALVSQTSTEMPTTAVNELTPNVSGSLSSLPGPPPVQLTATEVQQQIEIMAHGMLDRGATAVVFKCRWPVRFGPHALLAIKCMRDPYAYHMPQMLESFAYEVNVLSKFKHDNIIRMYGYCLEPPVVCIILELLPGSLKDRLYGSNRPGKQTTTNPWAKRSLNNAQSVKGPTTLNSNVRNAATNLSSESTMRQSPDAENRTESAGGALETQVSELPQEADDPLSTLPPIRVPQGVVAGMVVAQHREPGRLRLANALSTGSPVSPALVSESGSSAGRLPTPGRPPLPPSLRSTYSPSDPGVLIMQTQHAASADNLAADPAQGSPLSAHGDAYASKRTSMDMPHQTRPGLQITVTPSRLRSSEMSSRNRPHSHAGFSPQSETDWPPLPLAELLQISADIAAGLAHLHARPDARASQLGSPEMSITSQTPSCSGSVGDGIITDGSMASAGRVVHRDLKPANVLINSVGRAKISDFGLAREHQNTTVYTQHSGAGTLTYMAPELLKGSAMTSITDKVDIYSLGIVLWELATRTLPWKNCTDLQIQAMVTSGQRLPMPAGAGGPASRTSASMSPASTVSTCTTPAAMQLVNDEVLHSQPAYASLIRACWQGKPHRRPTAQAVAKTLQKLALDAVAQEAALLTDPCSRAQSQMSVGVPSVVCDSIPEHS